MNNTHYHFISNITENLDFRSSQSLGDGRSQAHISNTSDVAIAPTARAFASVQSQVFSDVRYIQFADNLFIGCLISALFLICGLRLLERKDLSFKTPITFKKVIGLTFLLFGIAGFVRALLTIKISSL